MIPRFRPSPPPQAGLARTAPQGLRRFGRVGAGALAVAMVAAACSESAPTVPVTETPTFPLNQPSYTFGQQIDACGLTLTAPLIVETLGPVGTVTVWNDQANVYVRYSAAAGVTIQATNGAVFGAPNVMPPSPSLFPLRTTHDPAVTDFTYTIPIEDEWRPGQAILYIAANAVVRVPGRLAPQSAWAPGGAQISPEVPAVINSHRLQACTGDAVVVGDANLFDNLAMENPGNQRFVFNTVALLTRGIRTGDKVWFDRGRGSACAAPTNRFGQPNFEPCSDERLAAMRAVITGANFTIENKNFAPGEMTAIPMDVRVIFFWTPRSEQAFTLAEVNLLRRFTAEGGRIVYISEWKEFYGDEGVVTTTNAWLQNMGAVARNVGQGSILQPMHDCATYTFANPRAPTWPPTSITYPVTPNIQRNTFEQGFTVDVADIKLACASAFQNLGADDVDLIRDRSGQHVLAGRIKVDTRGTGALRTPMTPTFSLQGGAGATAPSGFFLGSGSVAVN